MSAIYFQNKTLDSFISEMESGKNCVCFGAGRLAIYTLRDILEPNSINPLFFVDNDNNKQGDAFRGYSVKPPQELLLLDLKNTVVLITAMHPFSIKEQLDKLSVNNIYAACFFFESFMGKSYINISMK